MGGAKKDGCQCPILVERFVQLSFFEGYEVISLGDDYAEVIQANPLVLAILFFASLRV